MLGGGERGGGWGGGRFDSSISEKDTCTADGHSFSTTTEEHRKTYIVPPLAAFGPRGRYTVAPHEAVGPHEVPGPRLACRGASIGHIVPTTSAAAVGPLHATVVLYYMVLYYVAVRFREEGRGKREMGGGKAREKTFTGGWAGGRRDGTDGWKRKVRKCRSGE